MSARLREELGQLGARREALASKADALTGALSKAMAEGRFVDADAAVIWRRGTALELEEVERRIAVLRGILASEPAMLEGTVE